MLLPSIAERQVPGYQGAFLLRRDIHGEVAFATIMQFDSLEVRPRPTRGREGTEVDRPVDEFIVYRNLMSSRRSGPAITVDALEVKRGERQVLPGISLEVPPGQVTGLLGPSGCGKSTIMRAIVGVQIVAAGHVMVLGAPAGSAALRRRVGYVTQAPSVYADLTVRENLQYFARVLGVTGDRVDAVMTAVELTRHADSVTGNLSGGERSRCSLAVALLGEPELLVLDEPTVGLDPVLRNQLWETFHAQARTGTTILMSTHVMDEAERCDRLILMRDGRIVAQGTPRELLERTGSDTFEAAFLALAEGVAA